MPYPGAELVGCPDGLLGNLRGELQVKAPGAEERQGHRAHPSISPKASGIRRQVHQHCDGESSSPPFDYRQVQVGVLRGLEEGVLFLQEPLRGEARLSPWL